MQNEKRYTDWCSPQAQNISIETLVSRRNLCRLYFVHHFFIFFPLSLKNYQHQSVVARKTEKLEIIPVSSPRVAAVQLSPHGRLQIFPGTTSCHAVSACWQSHIQR